MPGPKKSPTIKSAASARRVPGVDVIASDDGETQAPGASAPRALQLDGTGQSYVTLAQFLKMQSLVPTGGAAKQMIRAGGFTVNGTAEDRPGRKLHTGDVVVAQGKKFTVAIPVPAPLPAAGSSKA